MCLSFHILSDTFSCLKQMDVVINVVLQTCRLLSTYKIVCALQCSDLFKCFFFTDLVKACIFDNCKV